MSDVKISNGKLSFGLKRQGQFLQDMAQDFKDRGIDPEKDKKWESKINAKLVVELNNDMLVYYLAPESLLLKSITDTTALDPIKEQAFLMDSEEAKQKLELFFSVLK